MTDSNPPSADAFVADDPLADEPVVRRPRRPMWLGFGVVGFGIYLLASMFEDFTYALGSGDAEDLGRVSELASSGRLPADLDNRHVRLRGTPDVQHAARLTTSERHVQYLRVSEAGGQLFVAVPRAKGAAADDTFQGVFEGRIRLLRATGAFGWVQQFFDREAITQSEELDLSALEATLGDREAVPEGADAAAERIYLTVSQPEVEIQLGRSSFPTAAAAEAKMVELGVPFAKLERPGRAFYSFVARIPDDRRVEVEGILERDLRVSDRTIPDPKHGALVLPRTTTYAARRSSLRREGADWIFPYDDNTVGPGYDLVDGKLVPRVLADGMVRVPSDRVRAAHRERPIKVDADAYVVLVGVRPSDKRLFGVLWLVVLGIVLANAVSLVRVWRSSRA